MAQVDSSRGIWRGQPFYVRLNAGGLLVFALAALVTAVILELGGQPGTIVPSAGIAVPSVVIALLVLRFSGWTLILATIWAVLIVLLTLLSLPTGFSHINSFWDFAAALTTTVAVLAASIHRARWWHNPVWSTREGQELRGNANGHLHRRGAPISMGNRRDAGVVCEP